MNIAVEKLPLSLYIHVPWCERKCPYCDFNSHQVRADIDESLYIQTLLDDLDADISRFGKTISDRAIQTVFIGGGTPSLFSAQSYKQLFSGLRERLVFAPNAEITLEANPGSSEVEKFSGFREAGINRLSVGIQSFNPSHLKSLGRVHNSQEAIDAASYAKHAGFDNFNLDLMFGLPEQTTEQALADLKQAIELTPTHLSCYQLTIEPNTLFHHNPPITPNDDALWEMQAELQALLAKYDYQQYEVSAYSQKEQRCQHNLNYWQFGDYLGIGAGAHAKLTNQQGDITRLWKIKHPSSYIDQEQKVGGSNAVIGHQRSFEFMMNALRLSNGFNLSLFSQRTHMNIETITPLLDKHQAQGLMQVIDNHAKPTEAGYNMLNNLLEDYLALDTAA